MYESYLRALLAPLGVYRLDRDSLSGAELYALGRGLDAVSDRLENVEQEAVTATAEDEGLRRREALFLRRPAAHTPEDRRAAIAWAVGVGVLLGCISAYYRGRAADSTLRVVCTLGISMPSFVVATLLLLWLCGAGKPFPTIFDGSNWRSYVLPCAALGFYPMCYIARQTRTSMLDALSQEYIKTARAKGLLTRKIVLKHALRNAFIPVLTYLGPQIAFTLTGGFVVEKVFTIPGLGKYFVQCISNRDYPVIMGTTIFLASFVIIMNLIVDLLYKVVDPRINLAKEG